ncbi:mechanosensitive ion channel family protein [Pedobacter hartonius]|uniref:Small conductance mechanosensitive channel n=1 Tax=Pedobacter hartonius TaxID=425514 RepID=A0A1H4HC47_9SPHI|nr:mechanosensitive ion channel family protein [Pedobacter hartonius]SEB19399.1 small conductance mechanosensitive channel [Pedobacter hartonius]
MIKEQANTDRTLQFYDKAFNWILDKGPNILIGIAILCIGLWLIKLFSKWMQSGLHTKNVDPSIKPFFISLSVAVLRILLFFTVMQFIGIQMTIFAALIGALGVAAGLALSGTLQNFASGVLILMLKPFKVGDNIIAQGQEGTVTNIEIFYTTVTTFDNRLVIVPNGKLSNEVIINISTQGSRRLDIEMKFSYGIDYDEILKITEETIKKSEDILKTPKHRVGVVLLEESGYRVMISVWLNSHGFNDAKLIFQEKLVRALKDGAIALPGITAK